MSFRAGEQSLTDIAGSKPAVYMCSSCCSFCAEYVSDAYLKKVCLVDKTNVPNLKSCRFSSTTLCPRLRQCLAVLCATMRPDASSTPACLTALNCLAVAEAYALRDTRTNCCGPLVSETVEEDGQLLRFGGKQQQERNQGWCRKSVPEPRLIPCR